MFQNRRWQEQAQMISMRVINGRYVDTYLTRFFYHQVFVPGLFIQT